MLSDYDTDDGGTGYGNGYGTGYGYGCGNGCGYSTIRVPLGGYTVSHNTPVIAYHYMNDRMCLHLTHPGERVRVDVGTILEFDGELELYRHGLHASLTPEDACRYAPTFGVLTKVACSGHVIYGRDKLVCTRREVLEVLNA